MLSASSHSDAHTLSNHHLSFVDKAGPRRTERFATTESKSYGMKNHQNDDCCCTFFLFLLGTAIYFRLDTSSDTLPIWLLPFILWLQVLNSAMNPVLYAIFNESFRLGFKKVIFRSILRRHNAQVVQSAHQNVHQRYQNPIQNIALVRFQNNTGLQR